jgi:DNA-binding NarL/FixJ family response regulator
MEGRAAVRPLQLALQRGRHAEAVAALLCELGVSGGPDCRPTVVPDTGEVLSPRELEVLQELADGRSNREIASRLYLSEGTVKNHVTNVLAKLGARDRVQAVITAFESGFIR